MVLSKLQSEKFVEFRSKTCQFSLSKVLRLTAVLMINIDSLLSLKAALYERHNVKSRCGWRAEK